jgi:hypothetical protein
MPQAPVMVRAARCRRASSAATLAASAPAAAGAGAIPALGRKHRFRMPSAKALLMVLDMIHGIV